MRVALIHYHLRGGGVTRIIWNQLKVLRDRGIDVIVLAGQKPSFRLPAPCKVVPGLLYEAFRPALDPKELVRQLKSAAREALGGAVDIWHFHNHSLGKNLILSPALRLLAQQGERLLLQIHDFAEDGRPGNYRAMLARMANGNMETLCRLLYPRGAHVHYAVINSRDYDYMRHAGLDAEQLHLLPNPVGFAADEQNPHERNDPVKESLCLYPTRAIRRKNIGEFLLWSALAPRGMRFATTAGPENPEEWKRYHRWRKVAAELRLPVSFEEAGYMGLSFVNLLRRADSVIATSVSEGFGMAFLEPWLLGTPFCGRDLPEITNSFRKDGFALPYTYERLDVPVEWIGRERIRDAAMHGLRRNLASYGRRPGEEDEERLMQAWIQDGRVDFGRLNEEMQEKVLRDLTCQPKKAADLRPSTLPQADDPQTLAWAMEQNNRILQSRYDLKQYGLTLSKIYERIARCNMEGTLEALNGQTLLNHFLAPERLSLLRVD